MKEILSHRGSISYTASLALAAALFILAAFTVSILASPPPPPPPADGKVTHTVSGNTETWRIDEPNVKKKIIEFPEIRFQAGDQVRVGGGGCVQTGGWGKTWKRYIDPLGPKSDELYHGMVLIPGAIGDLPANDLDRFARILLVRGVTYTVKPITEPRKQHLYLGYEDDNYDDNGYYAQDEGTQGQCKIGGAFLEHAFAVVTITHGGPVPTPGHIAPFDISTNINAGTPGNASVDDNFILLNPMWGRQISNHELPDKSQCGGGDPYSGPCTTQPTEEDHGFLCEYGTLGIVDGHHNWVPGTYEGTVFWNDLSDWIADGDYNFRLIRDDEAGATVENKEKAGKKSMKLEFSSDETINNFDTPWWSSFHKAVDKGFSAANAMIEGADGNPGAFGIVTGLIGLDCPHTCASELHPVWAMAIRVNSDPADETWAIFVRRYGNEGFCSDHSHYLDDLANDTYTFRLPWVQGASAVALDTSSTTFESQLGRATGSLGVSQNQGVLLSFTVPAAPIPLLSDMVDGELHLKWTIPPGGVHHLPVGVLRPPLAGAAAAPEDEPEDRLGRLLAGLTPVQRQTLQARLPRTPVSHQQKSLRLPAPNRIASLPIRRARAHAPVARSVPDPQKRARDQQRLDALHAIYGAQIPGFAPRPPRTPRMHP